MISPTPRQTDWKKDIFCSNLGGTQIGKLREQEVAVKAPRFRIASIMLIIAIAALNLGMLQARILRNHPLLLGALPMPNALAVCLVTAPTTSWKPSVPRGVPGVWCNRGGSVRRRRDVV
jgi:hypothetical protein